MRTGPLVRRSANVSRAGQPAPPASRLLPRALSKQHSSLTGFALTPTPPKVEIRSGCRLPINLRSFLAEQLGCRSEADDETILSFAAQADQLTLNKLARAIRRYSTARAREAWAECRVPVDRIAQAREQKLPAVLCLSCVRLDFGGDALREHQGSGCVPITLTQPDTAETGNCEALSVSEQIQRLVEEFRALRAAFGLPHFDLDCYVRGEQLTLMWRPLP